MDPPSRRSVLRSIGIGTATLVGAGTGVARPPGRGGGGGEAGLRVAHASPDAPAVDVYADGAKVISGLEFRQVTDYLEIPAGESCVLV